MPRTTRFELHIRPLFRTVDRLHMIQAANLDLWDQNQVATKSDLILRWLEGSKDPQVMPPTTHGGPWPQEWILLFYRWIKEGHPGLDLATASNYVAQRNGNFVTIDVTGQAPGQKYNVWLEHYFGPQNAGFALYMEPPANPNSVPTPFTVSDSVALPITDTTVSILDGNGIQTVNIT